MTLGIVDHRKFMIVRQEFRQDDEEFATTVIQPLLLEGWEISAVSTESWTQGNNTAIVFLRR